MDQYASYIWSAYGITLVVLLWGLVTPVMRRRRLVEMLMRKFQRDVE
ncbi:MAG: heme exporter protein CcmD [Thiotrichales bacterium]|nr:heme exporter protein CcmD [Thiotrichales bacterium]